MIVFMLQFTIAGEVGIPLLFQHRIEAEAVEALFARAYGALAREHQEQSEAAHQWFDNLLQRGPWGEWPPKSSSFSESVAARTFSVGDRVFMVKTLQDRCALTEEVVLTQVTTPTAEAIAIRDLALQRVTEGLILEATDVLAQYLDRLGKDGHSATLDWVLTDLTGRVLPPKVLGGIFVGVIPYRHLAPIAFATFRESALCILRDHWHFSKEALQRVADRFSEESLQRVLRPLPWE